jgi:hypothetical protein
MAMGMMRWLEERRRKRRLRTMQQSTKHNLVLYKALQYSTE